MIQINFFTVLIVKYECMQWYGNSFLISITVSTIRFEDLDIAILISLMLPNLDDSAKSYWGKFIIIKVGFPHTILFHTISQN